VSQFGGWFKMFINKKFSPTYDRDSGSKIGNIGSVFICRLS
jgi:hypothetical protein